MSFDIDVSFPGGKKVDAHLGTFTVHTDQNIASGGEGTAPSPFEMFFISLATCAGYYALEFCLSRGLNTQGLKVTLNADRDEAVKLYKTIKISINLPQDFPEKYRNAIVRAVDLCTVKRHVQAQLNFSIELLN
jgi:ribosomal protein S12 methylthiotransferase accessory factor